MIYYKKTENLHAALETHHLSPPRARPPWRRRRLTSPRLRLRLRLRLASGIAFLTNEGKQTFGIFISKITFFINKGKHFFAIFIPNIDFLTFWGKEKCCHFFIFYTFLIF